MNIFKTYKTQYEETLTKLVQSDKEVNQLTEKVKELEAKNKELADKASGAIVSKEDYEKLVSEHADFTKANKELTDKVASMEKEKVDVETLASKKALEIVSSCGIDKPLEVKTDTKANDNPYFRNVYGAVK